MFHNTDISIVKQCQDYFDCKLLNCTALHSKASYEVHVQMFDSIVRVVYL